MVTSKLGKYNALTQGSGNACRMRVKSTPVENHSALKLPFLLFILYPSSAMSQLRTSDQSRVSQVAYDAINQEYEEYDEEEWHISDRAKKGLVFSGMLLSLIILYLFCFVLPLLFIPPAQALEPILKVQELPFRLKPLAPERTKAWEGMSNSIEIDDSDEEDHDGFESGPKLEIDESKGTKERLVLIGDIHGQYRELDKLLKKIRYSQENDHVVVLGDFMSKGPKSLEVIDKLISLNALCVLGNHESYALANYAQFHNLKPAEYSCNSSQVRMRTVGFNLDPEYILAKKLEPRHIQYINSCSVMMKLGRVPLHLKRSNGNKGYAQGVAVHAGLRWDIADLEAQEPQDCLEMRSYIGPYYNETTDDPTEKNSVSWSKIYNMKQKAHEVAEQRVVYYGHDARRGLNLKKWAKGLDTGCVRGDMLTAMVMWRERASKGAILYKEVPVSVLC